MTQLTPELKERFDKIIDDNKMAAAHWSPHTYDFVNKMMFEAAHHQAAITRAEVLDEVKLKLQSFSDQMYSDCPIGEVTAWDMVKLYKAKHNELNTLINQINQLKKK